MSEIKTVMITTRKPRYDGDPGEIEVGHYKVVDGVLVMCSKDGRPTGKKSRLIGEDAHRVAATLLREAWLKRTGTSDFNRVIEYVDRGWR